MNIKEMMQLLDIKDVSTARQKKNGTVEWELPIKTEWSKRKIRVASFASGYVRCQLSDAYCSYQLNKRCQSEPQYFKLSNGDYRKFETRSCVLIPNEQDRLEYLISYCLKNYYINQANMIENGEFIPKWKYENMKNRFESTAMELSDTKCGALDNLSVIVNNERYKII